MTHLHASEHTQDDNARIVAVISYFTIVGWLIALIAYGSYKSPLATFHLRQSLGFIVSAAVLSFIPLIGWLLLILLALFWVISVIHAIKGDFYLVPKLGYFFQEHFTFIR